MLFFKLTASVPLALLYGTVASAIYVAPGRGINTGQTVNQPPTQYTGGGHPGGYQPSVGGVQPGGYQPDLGGVQPGGYQPGSGAVQPGQGTSGYVRPGGQQPGYGGNTLPPAINFAAKLQQADRICEQDVGPGSRGLVDRDGVHQACYPDAIQVAMQNADKFCQDNNPDIGPEARGLVDSSGKHIACLPMRPGCP